MYGKITSTYLPAHEKGLITPVSNDPKYEHLCELARVVKSIPMETEQGKLPPPPGLFASLMRGFDSVANHILVILPPVLLDLFLWLGPHLRLKSFLQPFIDQLPSLAKRFPIQFPGRGHGPAGLDEFHQPVQPVHHPAHFPGGSHQPVELRDARANPAGSSCKPGRRFVLRDLGLGRAPGPAGLVDRRNLLLLDLRRGAQTGSALALEIHETDHVPFDHLAGHPVRFGVAGPAGDIRDHILQPDPGQIMLFIGALLLVWLVMPVFFSAHGIFTLQLDAFRSILGSLRMVRFTLPNTGLFLLVFVSINTGLNFLWNTPSHNSWWMLVGIAGHAFVSTALLAASFIYYRDINAWLTARLEQLQTNRPTSGKGIISEEYYGNQRKL